MKSFNGINNVEFKKNMMQKRFNNNSGCSRIIRIMFMVKFKENKNAISAK